MGETADISAAVSLLSNESSCWLSIFCESSFGGFEVVDWASFFPKDELFALNTLQHTKIIKT